MGVTFPRCPRDGRCRANVLNQPAGGVRDAFDVEFCIETGRSCYFRIGQMNEK